MFLSHAHRQTPLSDARRPPGPSLSNFAQETLLEARKGIVFEECADNDHGMRPHDVYHRVPSHFREIVGGRSTASSWRRHTSFTRDSNSTSSSRCDGLSSGPLHVANDAAERKATVLLPLANCSKTPACGPDRSDRREDIFDVGSKLELTLCWAAWRVDACRSQAFQIVVMLSWIYHVTAYRHTQTRP